MLKEEQQERSNAMILNTHKHVMTPKNCFNIRLLQINIYFWKAESSLINSLVS